MEDYIGNFLYLWDSVETVVHAAVSGQFSRTWSIYLHPVQMRGAGHGWKSAEEGLQGGSSRKPYKGNGNAVRFMHSQTPIDCNKMTPRNRKE